MTQHKHIHLPDVYILNNFEPHSDNLIENFFRIISSNINLPWIGGLYSVQRVKFKAIGFKYTHF